MRKVFSIIGMVLALIVLSACNGKTTKSKLPDLDDKTKTQIELTFSSFEEDVNLIFEYQYSNDVNENLFIKYKEPLKTGDEFSNNDTITIILSAAKYRLPNLRGKNQTDIEALFSSIKTDYYGLEFSYDFEYVESTLAEGMFIEYQAPFEVGDVVADGAQITLIISQEKFRLPELTGKTKTEIESVFTNILSAYPSLEIDLSYEYVYDDKLEKDSFVAYKSHEVGDRITRKTEAVIYLSTYVLLPELENKTKTDIQNIFSELLKAKLNHGVTIEFLYYYDLAGSEDLFVAYLADLNEQERLRKNQVVQIALTGGYVTYPDLTGKTKNEIEGVFADLFAKYGDDSYTVEFKGYYDKTKAEDTFIEYDSEHQVGEKIDNNEIITITLSFVELTLPNLKNLKVFQIEELFEAMAVPLDRIIFMPSYSEYVEAGEFIKYDNYEIGDKVDFTRERVVIFYDARPTLPNLEELNKKQIEEALGELHITAEFEYLVDNNQEYDLFAGYKNNEVGDPITTNMLITIYLYKNDDVNVGTEIVNEKELFISKYIDGVGGSQGIELYNATDSDITLDDYYLAILGAGSYVPTRVIPLTGIIESEKTFVIVNDNSTRELLAKSDFQTSLMSFGGNANIQLRKTSNNTYIDAIYEVGNISVLMDNEIFVRRSEITHGRRDYNYFEWMGFVPDFYDLIGVHPYSGYSDPVFELIEDKTFQEYGMTKVKYLRAADGDTIYLESLDPRDETSYDGDNRIRFLLIDTPETNKPGQPGEPYANVATDFTVSMLKAKDGKDVEIYLQASREAGLIDTYGRHLGLIWANVGTEEEPDWKLLNYELLKAGLGQIMIAKTGKYYDHPIFGNRYLYQWAADADRYAQENKLGLYSGVHKP